MHTVPSSALQRATIWGLLHVFVRAVGDSPHGQKLSESNETHTYPGRLCRWEIEVGHPSSNNYNFVTAAIGWRLRFGHGLGYRHGPGVLSFETEGFDIEEWTWQAGTLPPSQDTPEGFSETLCLALRRYLKVYKVDLSADAKGVFTPN